MVRPGPRNLITDVDGILVGNAEDARAVTGATVVIPERPAVASADIRGGGPGTRETDLLDPAATVETVHGIALSGGSAFGLATADGVMAWLAARGRGFDVGGSVVPIVPGAILFDLNNSGDKNWGVEPPYRRLGFAACEAAARDFVLGNAGAGLGARAGNLKGGLGSASSIEDGGLQVGALIAVNSRGYVTMEGQKQFWAWPFEQGDEFGGLEPPERRVPLEVSVDRGGAASGTVRGHTTIGVVATNARLSKAEARRVAIMAQDGLARAIRPIHTSFDGDALFVLATGGCELAGVRPLALSRLGSIAADCVARATARGVYEARSAGGMVAWRDHFAVG
ncbi:MAG: P1 family peptidase [Reyranellaceae bacterium]